MRSSIFFLCLTLLLCLSSCTTKKKDTSASSEEKEVIIQKTTIPSAVKKKDKADSLVARTIAAHGGERYEKAHYGFKFRGKHYTFQNRPGGYTYTVTSQKNGEEIRDVLDNESLTRTINGAETELSPKDIATYTEALNSVVYFATLPHKLNDEAVNTSFKGRKTIKGQGFEVLSVTFDQEGGGTDHDDKFMYWINTNTGTIDFLAYSYKTNDGGVRFRSAYNPRIIGGIRFQDYINYEAAIGTALIELPKLHEAGELKELSKIETQDVTVIKD